MRRSKITGTGRYLPETIVTNDDLKQYMDTSDEWITERTGVKERRFAGNGNGSSKLGYRAAVNAIEKAGLKPEDIDFIVAATVSPDYFFPGIGCLIGEMLGIPGIGAIDVRNQCCGFIYGLSTADAFIRSGMYDRVLVIGSEVQSCGMNISTEGRDTAVIFGDGSGAVVLEPTEDGGSGLLSHHLHADGTYATALWMESPGSHRTPMITHEILDEGRCYPLMNGNQVFKHAVKRFPEVIAEALDANSLSVDDITLVIPHQANYRITQMVAKRIGIGMEKVFSNIHKYGNTTAASIPIALDEALEEKRIKDGDLVILAAFGSGFTWASSAIRW